MKAGTLTRESSNTRYAKRLQDRSDSWMPVLTVKSLLRTATLAALALSSSACTLRYVYDTPDFRTKITDAQTKLPIKGANVTVWAPDNPSDVGRGISDVNGNVYVGSLVHKTWVFANFDPLPPNGMARIEARGYETREVPAPAGLIENPPVELVPNP